MIGQWFAELGSILWTLSLIGASSAIVLLLVLLPSLIAEARYKIRS